MQVSRQPCQVVQRPWRMTQPYPGAPPTREVEAEVGDVAVVPLEPHEAAVHLRVQRLQLVKQRPPALRGRSEGQTENTSACGGGPVCTPAEGRERSTACSLWHVQQRRASNGESRQPGPGRSGLAGLACRRLTKKGARGRSSSRPSYSARPSTRPSASSAASPPSRRSAQGRACAPEICAHWWDWLAEHARKAGRACGAWSGCEQALQPGARIPAAREADPSIQPCRQACPTVILLQPINHA